MEKIYQPLSVPTAFVCVDQYSGKKTADSGIILMVVSQRTAKHQF
jgi:hypothetical protein